MILVVILLGLFLGSFVNMLVYRIPLDKDIIFLRSHCTTCKKTLGVKDLIPIVSYLFYRGKCRYCNGSIGKKYLIIELTALVYSIALYYRFGINKEYYIELIIAVILISISFIDIFKMIIPDGLVGIIAALSIVSISLESYLYKDIYPIINSFRGIVFTFLVWIAIYYLSNKSVGHGDIKLFMAISIALGFMGSINAFIISHITAAVVSIVLMLLKKKDLKSIIPFGPFIALSYFAVIVLDISLI